MFNALLKKQSSFAKASEGQAGLAKVANYPFATIEPNVGVVPVPDERLAQLADLVSNEYKDPSTSLRTNRPPIVPATVRFVDIAGLVKGASQGEGLGNQFLSHIREVDAIVQVVRNFSDENVIRSGSTEPKSDMEVVNMELVLADLQTIQKSKLKNQSDRSKMKSVVEEAKILASNKLEIGLNAGKLAKDIELTDEEREAIKGFQLLTNKPFIYVLNSDEDKVAELSQGADPVIASLPAGGQGGARQSDHPVSSRGVTTRGDLSEIASDQTLAMTQDPSRNDILYVSAKLEAELSALSEEEQKDYLSQLNIKESGLDKVIKKAYEILGLITFLTAGPKEVRAWTTKKGSKAPQAAGVIHTDFERGFIAAEVISTEDLLSAGSFRVAKDLGKIRLEGKEYVMQDGDVVEFRFSV